MQQCKSLSNEVRIHFLGCGQNGIGNGSDNKNIGAKKCETKPNTQKIKIENFFRIQYHPQDEKIFRSYVCTVVKKIYWKPWNKLSTV